MKKQHPQGFFNKSVTVGVRVGSAHAEQIRRPKILSLAALALVSGLALSGCSSEYWPQFGQAQKPNAVDAVANPTVSEAQMSRIIESVVNTAYTADVAADAELLSVRFADEALAQRTANYKIRANVAEYPVKLPYLRSERLGYELVQQTSGWPRTMFVSLAATDNLEAVAGASSEGNEATLGLLLTQKSPFENYKVTRAVTLRGVMPEATPTAEGTAVLDNAVTTLAIAPQDLGAVYAELLLHEQSEVPQAALFQLENDPILTHGGKAWVAAESARAAGQTASANYSVQAVQEGTPVALSTGTGGAIVMTTVVEYRTVEAGENSEITVSNVVAAVSDLSGKKKKIVQQVQHQLLFYVPRAESNEKIQLLGNSSEIVGASS